MSTPPETEQFEGRKREHIQLARDERHQAAGLSGLDRIRLRHDALPELDLDDVRLDSARLGVGCSRPYYVAGMTAGHPDAREINRRLAAACARHGWAFGVGSQRRELADPGQGVLDWAALRAELPDLVLIGNIGAAQVAAATPAAIADLALRMGAQALAVHLNVLQECFQPEGTPKFAGVIAAITALAEASPVPVIVKETGCGIGPAAARKLAVLPIAAVDVSGLGGTHWGRIEGSRAGAAGDDMRANAAAVFADWGEPTVDSVLSAVAQLSGTEIWASGGVRSGLDAAKLIALGAHQVGYARPALLAALAGPDELEDWMTRQEFELRVALLCSGCASPRELRGRTDLWTEVAS